MLPTSFEHSLYTSYCTWGWDHKALMVDWLGVKKSVLAIQSTKILSTCVPGNVAGTKDTELNKNWISQWNYRIKAFFRLFFFCRIVFHTGLLWRLAEFKVESTETLQNAVIVLFIIFFSVLTGVWYIIFRFSVVVSTI